MPPPAIQKGDYVRIKDNVETVLKELGFDRDAIQNTVKLVGTEQYVHDTWDDGEPYATIDLCVEVPFRCCEKIEASNLALAA